MARRHSRSRRERFRSLTEELRCPKCQNQDIADSNAPIAADLRREVAEQLAAGRSDDDVREYMAARYGDFILFRPRMSARTAWLWSLPGLLLIGGAIVAWRIVRQRAALAANDPDFNGDELDR